MEKYITFSVPFKKCNDGKTITKRFFDSFRFMSASLSSGLVDNLSGIFISKVYKKCVERNEINSECRFAGLKGDRLEYKCRECGEKWRDSINKFPSIYQFCNGDLNKFILLLRKGVYPYEDMDNWEKFDETTIPPKEAFYSKLNLENISDEDYAHVQKVWKVFGIKNRGEYHDLYVLCDTLLIADLFENFRDKCIEIYEVDPSYFVSARALAWEANLKRTEVELELLADYDMLLIVENGVRVGICPASHRYAKANNEFMNHNEDIESYVAYLDANNLYGWAMSQKLPINGFKWVENLSKFNEDLIKNMMKIVIWDIFLK